MKIGIMLRHMDQHEGGLLFYTRNLLRELHTLDTSHELIFIYRNPRLVGSYGKANHVREMAITAPNIFAWDQVAMRRVEKQEKLDLIFNPKYSVPLLANCRTAFVCHGLDWYVMPRWSRWFDRLSHRYLIPRYAQKADVIIAVSDTARRHVIEYLDIDERRVHTVYLGVDDAFSNPVSMEKKEEVRRAHQLPSRFLLYCGQIYPPKNFGRLLQAFARVGPKMGVSLVVAGQHTWLCEHELALIEKLGISPWVACAGWIDRTTLPTFYALAEALLLPSLYEACPSPILEAMSSGCPVVTSNRYGTAEIAGGAAILVDPENVESIADGIREVMTNQELRHRLVDAGRTRARDFSWKKCARETLKVLDSM
jgi:glycosyltransferase involved in cell wall biosynthesis